MQKIISIFLLTILVVSCSNDPWDDEYFIKDNSGGHHNLDCSNEEAKEIAANAVKDKYPRHYEKFLSKGFSIFSPLYGEINGKDQWHYTYKTIFGYKAVEHQRMSGSYYEESIEVSLTKSCQVLDVAYFKGKVEYIE